MPRLNLSLIRRKSAVLDALEVLSRVFWGPDDDSCRAMITGGYLLPFEILSPLMSVDPPTAVADIKAFISSHSDAGSLFEALETSYVRLFISNRGGIAAPLHQSCYTEEQSASGVGLLMGAPAADMRRRLESAGLALDEKISSMPDHLSVEIEYLYYLVRESIGAEDDGMAGQTRFFCTEVVLPWAGEFRRRLRGAAENNPFYPLMASLLMSLLTLISGT